MTRPENGRAVFHTRDSGGKAEMTPGQYVLWAKRRAAEMSLAFDGDEATIYDMIRDGVAVRNDIYLDYDFCGNLLSRPGLDALRARVASDPSVTHILIPRRDRLARPDDPIDGMKIELDLRRSGRTLVFMDRVVGPIARGKRVDIGDLIASMVDYDNAGKDRRVLAEKVLNAQLALIRAGFSTGGRAPYETRRWLIRADGTPVRQLMDGERVRMAGHHVVWLPCELDHPHMQNIMRVRAMLKSTPASRVARIFTEEGIPAPDSGRTRKDNGVVHLTSGIWNQTTIVNVGRSGFLTAVCSYGQRSMGDQLRFSPVGPRELQAGDYIGDSEDTKVIRNAADLVQHGPAHFEPVVDRAEHEELQRILDERGAGQRGKARSRDPGTNPLGTRQFDMDCGWPLYRTPYDNGFRYTRGFYSQSHGQQCNHNFVDGPTATRFALNCVSQKIFQGGLLDKLTKRLRELAMANRVHFSSSTTDLAGKRNELKQVQIDVAKTKRNMALADSPSQRKATAEVYEELLREEEKLQKEIIAADVAKHQLGNPEAEVAAALAMLDRLDSLVEDKANLAAIGQAFSLVNLRIFYKFQKTTLTKRIVNKVRFGVVTFGSEPPPVRLYAGPTGRRALKAQSTALVAAKPGGGIPLPDRLGAGREGNSLGNVNRGDRI